jgi:hypothetical protein
VINLFLAYAELLAYEPFEYVLEAIKKQRPPMEAEIVDPLFKFIINTFARFLLFESWDEVWLTKGLVN